MITQRKSQLTKAVSLSGGFYHPQPPLPFIVITQPKSW